VNDGPAVANASRLRHRQQQWRRLADSSTTISVAAHPAAQRPNSHVTSSAPVRAFNALLLQSPAMGALPTLRAAIAEELTTSPTF
jgi:hypothetical protein